MLNQYNTSTYQNGLLTGEYAQEYVAILTELNDLFGPLNDENNLDNLDKPRQASRLYNELINDTNSFNIFDILVRLMIVEPIEIYESYLTDFTEYEASADDMELKVATLDEKIVTTTETAGKLNEEVENQLKNHFSYNNILYKFGLKQFGKFRETSYLTKENIKHKNILDFHQNSVRNFFSSKEIAELGINAKYYQQYSFKANPHSLNDIMRTDLEKYVPGNMLVKSDRMAMANSLEVRTPFLDKDFAEFCIQLPENLKLDSENDKIILREAMGNYWTETIRNRHKQGFGSSVEKWFEEKNLMELSDDLLKNRSSKVFDFIHFSTAQKYLNRDKKHWNLLQLALWADHTKQLIH